VCFDLTIGEAVMITGANRNTLTPHFKNLIEGGFTQLHGQLRRMAFRT
jgi:hypothetical protein